ncbi:MAG: hypothetical protein KC593_10550, partial [Myxococcales bacterium]|nr:hypothetical protein [Myxococcales bacterium]
VPGSLGVVTSVDAGFNHTCAVDAAGNASCWGLFVLPPDLRM